MRQDNGRVVDRAIVDYGCVEEHNMIFKCESFEGGKGEMYQTTSLWRES